MYDVRTRIDQDLTTAVSRLRQLDGAAAVGRRPGAIGDTCFFADEVDGMQASESREIGFATREQGLRRPAPESRSGTALERTQQAPGRVGSPL